MKKVLLLIEDYTERAFLNSLLKRVGWDVEAIQSELGMNDLLLSFSPNVIIATGFGVKIHGEQLKAKLNKLSLKAEVILILKQRKTSPEEEKKWGVYSSFQSPIDVQKLFNTLEEMGGISAQLAFSKLAARVGGDGVQAPKDRWVHNAGKEKREEALQTKSMEESEKAFQNPLESLEQAKSKLYKHKFDDPQRRERNSEFIKNNPLPESKFNGLDPNYVKKQTEEFRRLEDDPEIHSIDEERKSFVTAMFKLAKGAKK